MTGQAPAEIRACHGKRSMHTLQRVLQPQRIQSSQTRQTGVSVSISRRKCSSESKKSFSGTPVMAFWSSHQKSAEIGTEPETMSCKPVPLPHDLWTVCWVFLPRTHTTEGSLSFTDYCLLKFTSECLVPIPNLKNNYNRYWAVSGSAVQNMAKSSL